MATYYIVDKDKDPLGPNEINAGGKIEPSEGDVFIFTSTANSSTTFETANSTHFEVRFNESNVNRFTAEFKGATNPDISIADSVDLSDVFIKAQGAESANLTIGDNVTLDRYEGSDSGSDNVVIGDNFTTFNSFNTKGGDDTIEVGSNASAPDFEGGNGNDTITTRSHDTTRRNFETENLPDGVVDGTSGDDVIGSGYQDWQSDAVDGPDGDDDLIVGYTGSDTIDGGAGNDTIYGDYSDTISEPPAPTATSERLTFDIQDTDAADGNVSIDLSTFGTPDAENHLTITDSAESSTITILDIAKIGNGDGQPDVFEIDLSTFDDDFTIVIKSEGIEDEIRLSGVVASSDNGDGTTSYTYFGDDGLEHTVTVDSGVATVVEFTSPPPASTSNDDNITAGAGDDFIDAGFGDDIVDAGIGNDTITISEGADTIHGGAGTDTYDASNGTSIVGETIDVSVDQAGDGTAIGTSGGSTDTVTSIESFVADEVTGQTDVITIDGQVNPTSLAGLSDAAVGTFTHTSHGLISFGGAGEPTFSELMSGTYVHPTHGPVSPFGTVQITSGDESGQVGNIAFSNFEEINFSVVCYAPGTLIETPEGPRDVADLCPGDEVLTVDHGAQKVCWWRASPHSVDRSRGDDFPILIGAGALGTDTPVRDLIVSPQHRILAGGNRQMERYFEEEILIPAKSLTGLPQAELTAIFGQRPASGAALNGPPVRPLIGANKAIRQINSYRKIVA